MEVDKGCRGCMADIISLLCFILSWCIVLLSQLRGFIILILYPLIAALLEPFYMNKFKHFYYPQHHPLKRVKGVPLSVIIGWGWVTFFMTTLIQRLFLVQTIIAILLIPALLGYVIELIGTEFKLWIYQEPRTDSELMKSLIRSRKRLRNIPPTHIAGYSLFTGLALLLT